MPLIGNNSIGLLVLTDDETVSLNSNTTLLASASGADRALTLPAIDKAFWYAGGEVRITNIGATYAITIKQPDGEVLDTLQPDDYGRYYGANTKWYIGDSTSVKEDYFISVARGNISGATIMEALGERESMGTTAAGEEIWRGNELTPAPTSHTLIPIPAAAGEQMTVVSEHANDASGNVGAEIITIEYLDADGAQQTTTVTMNGTTPVDLTPSDVRFVNDMYVSQVGSNSVAVGNIKIYQKADSGLVYNMIAAGGNKSVVPRRMVPAGKTLLLDHWSAQEAQAKRVNVRIRADCTPDGTRQAGVFLFKGNLYLNANTSDRPLFAKIPQLSIVTVAGWPDAITAEVGVHWSGILVDN